MCLNAYQDGTKPVWHKKDAPNRGVLRIVCRGVSDLSQNVPAAVACRPDEFCETPPAIDPRASAGS